MEEETTVEEKKELKAKPVSLIGQIVAAVWVAGWTSWQNAQDIIAGRHIDVLDIGLSGLLIVACFSPVYLNLFMDKIRDIKWGTK